MKMLLWNMNPLRLLAGALMPFFEVMRYRYLGGMMMAVPELQDKPSLEDKVLAAIFIAAHGADAGGIRTWSILMAPQRNFTFAEVEREASRFLGVVQLALLTELPHPARLQILQDQAAHLSFAE